MKRNKGRFKRGYDERRHLLTPEERKRGGETRWRQVRAIWRAVMNLPMPHYATPEYMADLERRSVQGC